MAEFIMIGGPWDGKRCLLPKSTEAINLDVRLRPNRHPVYGCYLTKLRGRKMTVERPPIKMYWNWERDFRAIFAMLPVTLLMLMLCVQAHAATPFTGAITGYVDLTIEGIGVSNKVEILEFGQKPALLGTRSTLSFPVASILPASETNMALDIMPGTTNLAMYGSEGIAWIDVADRNCLTNAGMLRSLRLGILPNEVQVGSRAYGGETLVPLVFDVGQVPYMQLHSDWPHVSVYAPLLTLRRSGASPADYQILTNDSWTCFHNFNLAGGRSYYLPQPISGLTYSFVVATAQPVAVWATNGVIYIGSSHSSVNGYALASTVGSTLTLMVVNTNWFALSHEGSWSFGP